MDTQNDTNQEASPQAESLYAYVLRTCNADMTAHKGFRWPENGAVSAPDWKPTSNCGSGLHGLLMGEGDASLLNWDTDAKWLVVQIPIGSHVDLGGKVKFPSGEVVFCGDRLSATTRIIALGANPSKCVGGTATAGDGGTATAGKNGTLSFSSWDQAADRKRVTIGYIGDVGLVAGKQYRLDSAGKIVEVV